MPWAHIGVLVLAASLGSAAKPYAATHPAVYAGTYAVRICHGSCVGYGASAFRTGTMVLFERPLRDRRGHTFHGSLDRDAFNACFVLEHTGARFDGDTFIPTQGFFSWALWQHAVALELVRSPDGGYGVTLHFTPDGLGGIGATWGGTVGAVAPDSPRVPPDSVSAVRMGEPDITKCPPLPDSSETEASTR